MSAQVGLSEVICLFYSLVDAGEMIHKGAEPRGITTPDAGEMIQKGAEPRYYHFFTQGPNQ